MRDRLCANCATRYSAKLDRCPECSAHAPKTVDAAPEVQTGCIAHGCPLPGTGSDSTRGGAGWVCTAHRSAPSSDWQEVTARIRANEWLRAICCRIAEIGPVLLTGDDAQKGSARLVERGVPSLGWEPHEESPAQWGIRVQAGYWTLVITGKCDSKPKPRPWQFKPGNAAALAPQQAAA
jgi:hypothetical protein